MKTKLQEIIKSLLGGGGQVIVIDYDQSFKESFGGPEATFIEFDSESNISINPFSVIDEDEFEQDSEYRKEVTVLMNLIVRQMCRPQGVTNNIENMFIEEAIEAVWSQHRGGATITNVADFLVEHEDRRVRELGNILEPFTSDGIYSNLFKGASDCLDGPYYVLKLDKLGNNPDLKHIVLQSLMFLVTEKLFNGDERETTAFFVREGRTFYCTKYVEWKECIVAQDEESSSDEDLEILVRDIEGGK